MSESSSGVSPGTSGWPSPRKPALQVGYFPSGAKWKMTARTDSSRGREALLTYAWYGSNLLSKSKGQSIAVWLNRPVIAGEPSI
jgi:hypothetical protein